MNKIKLAILVGTLLAPVALVILLAKSNRKREERFRQWLSPWVALAFVVLCCLFAKTIDNAVGLLLDQPFMQPVKDWIHGGSGLQYGLKLYTAYLVNIGVLTAYLVFKNTYRGFFRLTEKVIRFFIRLIRGKKKKEDKSEKTTDPAICLPEQKGLSRLYWEWINLFYSVDDGTFVVREKWLAAGKTCLYAARILGGLYLAFLLFAQLPLLAGFSWYPYGLAGNIIENAYVWPAVSLVLILEFVYFLGGKEEFDRAELIPEEKTEEKPEEANQPDYRPLLDIFDERFPERRAAQMKAPTYPQNHEEVTPKTELAQSIYTRLTDWEKKTGRKIEKSVIDCITSLPEGGNTVIDAQLSSDFGECLMLYVNVILARGDNLLVLCRDEETCVHIREYIDSVLSRINGLAPIWMVRSVEDAYQSSDCDVLVVTPDAIMNETVRNAQKRFFDRLNMVLMVDISNLIAEMGMLMIAATRFLETGREKELQYIALSNGIPNELRATLEQSFSPGRPFRAFECFSSNSLTRIMLWNYEPAGEGKVRTAQSNLFGSSVDQVYLGVALPLALLAVKNGVKDISIMGNHIPSKQLIDSLRLRFSQMSGFFDGKMNADDVIDCLHFQTVESVNPFIVAIDSSYNLPMTIRNYSRYIGNSSAMVHIISKPYMLRDYFAAFAEKFMLDKARMEMLTSIFRDTAVTTAIRLVFQAGSAEGLREEDLMTYIRSTGASPSGGLQDGLKELYRVVRRGEPLPEKTEDYFAVSTKPEFVREKNDFVYQRRIMLKDRRMLHELIGDIRPAVLQLHGERITLGIESGNLYRYYLPDQTIVAHGRMYYIDAVDGQNGMLIANREIENLLSPVDYIQHRQYMLGTEKPVSERLVSLDFREKNDEAGKFEVELFRNVEINVDTLGYLSLHPSLPAPNLTSREQYRELGTEERERARRVRKDGSVLSVRFVGVDPEEADDISVTMAVLFSEIMKTLFQYSWQCIAVCPVIHGDMNKTENQGVQSNGETGDYEEDEPKEDDGIPFDNLALIYPQLIHPENWAGYQNKETAEILIIEDSETETGMLDALLSDRQHPMSNIISLLLDYLKWLQDWEEKPEQHITGNYLKFGAEGYPGFFRFDIARSLLEQLEIVHPEGMEDPTAKQTRCAYCGNDLRTRDYVILRDENGKKERKVCTQCAKYLLNKKSQLMPLVEEIRAYMLDSYGAELPAKFPVKFVSAKTMGKQLPKKRHKGIGKIIGLAFRTDNTVLVEINQTKERTLQTLVHEMTHVWQFNQSSCNDSVMLEGHSSYMEVQYLQDQNDEKRSTETANGLQQRDDEYGKGYRKLKEIMDGREDKNSYHYMQETFPTHQRRKKN